MRFLNYERTTQLWGCVNAALTKKQDKIAGSSGQIIGFDETGEAVPYAMGIPGGVATLDASGILAAAQRPGLSEIEGGSRRNLLDNWYFVAPINQRKQTVYTGPGYTIDRWKLNAPSKLSLLDGFVRLEQTNAGDKPLYYQPIEQEIGVICDGKTLTFSVLYRTASPSFSLEIQDGRIHTYPIPVSTELTCMSITATLSGTLNYVGIKFDPPMDTLTKDYIDLIAVKIEPGKIQTLAEKIGNQTWTLKDLAPDRASELVRYQRYQFNINNGLSERFCVGMGNAITSTLVLIDVPLLTPMRAKPCVSFSGEWYVVPDTVYTWGKAPSLPVEDIMTNQLSNNLFTINVAVQNAVLGQRYRLVCIHADKKSFLLLDANI